MREIIKERGSVYCNNEVWEILNRRVSKISPTKIFILTDSNTHKYCLPYLLNKINFEKEPTVLTIPHGESNKNIDTCQNLWKALSNNGCDRKSLIINLGGGMVTDIGGFVACTFMRGIEFINIPTSLLAMVDASIGGKNGIDLGILKNQIGVIKNPIFVIVDINFLESMPPAELTSGFAEMLKHGLIFSEEYLEKLESFNINKIHEAEALIWESIQIKNQIVTEDPFEQNRRKTLNFGHTLGHAIESYFMENKNKILHGEAVAAGMILALYVSHVIFNFPIKKLNEITNFICQKFPKHYFSENEVRGICNLMVFDKKNSEGKVLFVLLKDIGDYKTNCEVPNDLIIKAFEYYKKI